MQKFNKQLAEQHLNKLLKFYKIRVRAWSRTPIGRAYYNDRSVKIPKVTNIENFCVALHEVAHIRNGSKGYNYIQEYNAEQFAISEAQKLGFDTTEYEEIAKWYVLMMISKGYCRKLNLDAIPLEIKEWLAIDFENWKNKRVWVDYRRKRIDFY